MPQLAGTYSSELSSEMGTGTTRQDIVQKLGWFAIYLDDDRVVVRALSADGLPTIVSKVLSPRVFFADYTPDESIYVEKIMPLLESARAKLVTNGGDDSVLEKDEKVVFRALVLEKEHMRGASKEDRKKTALEMLSDLPSFAEVAAEHKQKINTESIASRKDGDYDQAIDLYGAMLRVTPNDDHIFFNVARVYFEKKDFASCRNYLKLALEHDPGFAEADKFLKYLDERVPQEQPDGRLHLRYRFLQNQPCTVTMNDEAFEAWVVDMSEAGMQLRMAPGAKADLKQGAEVLVRGESEILNPLVPGNEARIVWSTKTTCGVAFSTSLDSTTEEFRGIIAYSRLA